MKKEFLDEVRRAVAAEVRCELLMHAPEPALIPPRSDIEAERVLISLLLNRSLTVAQMAPLLASDFFVPLHRELVIAIDALAATKRPVTRLNVLKALAAMQTVTLTKGVAEQIDVLASYEWADAPIRQECMERVAEASRARVLSKHIRDIDHDLRTGRITSSNARERLSSAAKSLVPALRSVDGTRSAPAAPAAPTTARTAGAR